MLLEKSPEDLLEIALGAPEGIPLGIADEIPLEGLAWTPPEIVPMISLGISPNFV